ncbi:MAG: hypothetical protein K6U11_03495 [bacterium]|nr:hypothetical protein [bacterium]
MKKGFPLFTPFLKLLITKPLITLGEYMTREKFKVLGGWFGRNPFSKGFLPMGVIRNKNIYRKAGQSIDGYL